LVLAPATVGLRAAPEKGHFVSFVIETTLG
jgi:hypothetical protein